MRSDEWEDAERMIINGASDSRSPQSVSIHYLDSIMTIDLLLLLELRSVTLLELLPAIKNLFFILFVSRID